MVHREAVTVTVVCTLHGTRDIYRFDLTLNAIFIFRSWVCSRNIVLHAFCKNDTLELYFEVENWWFCGHIMTSVRQSCHGLDKIAVQKS